jgi:ABC-2 type transport system permease protein
VTEGVVARRAFRQIWLGASVWALAFGATIAASAITYADSFPDRASRLRLLASTGRDRGFSLLLGPEPPIDSVGGYTVYKGFVFLTSIGAVWGLLIATRLLRGEEDAGRWQLVLAGRLRAARATGATLVALFAAVGVVFAGTTAITLLAARDPDVAFGTAPTILYGLSLAIAPAVFVAVGALTSQLGRTRRVATGLGMVTFAVAFVVRMIADSGESAKWLLWFTPFGWIERIRPYTDNDPRPLLVAAAATAVLVGSALTLAGRRDAGSGVIATSDTSPLRPRGLRSYVGLVARLDAPVLFAWCVGALTAGFAFGTIASVASGSVPSSVRDTLEKFGVHGSLVAQYFGVVFLFFATILALLPVAGIGAAAGDDTSGRLGYVLTQPVARVAVLAERIALVAIAIVATGVSTGMTAWLGAKTQGVDPGFGRLAGPGLNLVPTALLVLGVGVLTLSIAPRAAVRVVYGVVIGSLLVDLVASLSTGAAWLGHFSVFRYMALAPAEAVDPATVVGTLLVAGLLCGAALLVFTRRDIHGA